MNLSCLNFERAYRLQSVKNLMRVTEAYHKMLRRRSGVSTANGCFVEPAKSMLSPRLVSAWESVLALMRGADIQRNLASLAQVTKPVRVPGQWNDFMSCRYDDVGGPVAAQARAHCIVRYIEAQGDIPVFHLHDWKRGASVVRIETDGLNMAILWYSQGVSLELLTRWCGVPAREIFWWVPAGYTGLVNPTRRPIMTPDFGEQVAQILSTTGT